MPLPKVLDVQVSDKALEELCTVLTVSPETAQNEEWTDWLGDLQPNLKHNASDISLTVSSGDLRVKFADGDAYIALLYLGELGKIMEVRRKKKVTLPVSSPKVIAWAAYNGYRAIADRYCNPDSGVTRSGSVSGLTQEFNYIKAITGTLPPHEVHNIVLSELTMAFDRAATNPGKIFNSISYYISRHMLKGTVPEHIIQKVYSELPHFYKRQIGVSAAKWHELTGCLPQIDKKEVSIEIFLQACA
jgi:hypothetical protein